MAGTYLIEQKELDPVVVVMNVASIAAGVLVMIRIGMIAASVLSQSSDESPQVIDTRYTILI